jgi:hypothetical protein
VGYRRHNPRRWRLEALSLASFNLGISAATWLLEACPIVSVPAMTNIERYRIPL